MKFTSIHDQQPLELRAWSERVYAEGCGVSYDDNHTPFPPPPSFPTALSERYPHLAWAPLFSSERRVDAAWRGGLVGHDSGGAHANELDLRVVYRAEIGWTGHARIAFHAITVRETATLEATIAAMLKGLAQHIAKHAEDAMTSARAIQENSESLLGFLHHARSALPFPRVRARVRTKWQLVLGLTFNVSEQLPHEPDEGGIWVAVERLMKEARRQAGLMEGCPRVGGSRLEVLDIDEHEARATISYSDAEGRFPSG